MIQRGRIVSLIVSLLCCRVVKSLASNKEDRKRVEKAMEASGLPSGKVRTLSAQLTMDLRT